MTPLQETIIQKAPPVLLQWHSERNISHLWLHIRIIWRPWGKKKSGPCWQANTNDISEWEAENFFFFGGGNVNVLKFPRWFYLLWPHWVVCGILVPRSGNKPWPLPHPQMQWKRGGPPTGPPGKSPQVTLIGSQGCDPLSYTGGSDGKESACDARDLGSIPGLRRSLEESVVTLSSILAWRIPWTEEPGGLQSMGLQRVEHNWAAKHGASCNRRWGSLGAQW